jgi:HK97 family phage major capsid protein
MLKTFKEWLGANSNGDWSAQTVEEKARLQKEYMQYVSEELKKAQENAPKAETTEEKAQTLKDTLKSLTDSQEMKDFETRIKEAEEKALQALESASKGGKKGVTLEKAISDEKDAIKALVKGGSTKEVVLKADTLRAAIATNPSGYFLPDIGQLGVKAPGLYDVLPKVPVSTGNHQGVIRYVDWDEATTASAAATVAEGAAFPESTAKFKGYSKEIIKVGDTLPVSEEFGEDEQTAAAELEMFLDTNLRTVRDDKLMNGPGTAGEIEGLLAASPAYVPAAAGIVAPNIYDLVKKVKTSITFNRGSKYAPDMVVMNDNTADELHLTKDANENYVFPDTMNIGSMVIVIDNNMADNQLVVGDRRYARIYEMVGITLSRGLVADQFVEDMETIKVRTRLLMLIRNVDKTGFAKVTDIDAALVTIGS